MDYTSEPYCFFLALLIKKRKTRDRNMCTHSHTQTHMHTCSQTHWHRQTGPTIRRFEKQLYSLTYPLITPPPDLRVCFFESFISVASSTVFHSVKIEAIILPNAYLPALYSPPTPVHEGFYMMRWLTCSTHTIHYHMYTGWDSACATYTNACLVCPVGVGDTRAYVHTLTHT